MLPRVTLEPVIFFFVFFNALMNGAQQADNLLLLKICRYELHFNQTVCDNRADYDAAQVKVQQVFNIFGMECKYMAMGPTFLYVLVAGGLSDDFGRKPLILLPVLGSLFSKVVNLLGYFYIEELPLQFWYLTNGFSFLGGIAIYYMGVYGYGSSAVSQSKRATLLARYDGVEQASLMAASALSPTLFQYTGYSGCFLTGIFGNILAALYLVFLCPEPVKKKSLSSAFGDESQIKRLQHFFNVFIWKPFSDMVKCILEKRPRGLRNLLFLAIFNYCLYLFILEGLAILYLFMLRQFDGFTGADFAYYRVITRLEVLIGLFIVVPFFSGRLQLHESGLLAAFSALTCLGYMLSAMATRMWPDFYLSSSLEFLRMSLYAMNRSLITRCISSAEIGKVFSAIAFFAALLPFFSTSTYRILYNKTVETFPGCFLLLSASAMGLASIINCYIFTQRDRMGELKSEMGDEEPEKSEDEANSKEKVETHT